MSPQLMTVCLSLKNLEPNKEIILINPDKGNYLVLLNKRNCIKKMENCSKITQSVQNSTKTWKKFAKITRMKFPGLRLIISSLALYVKKRRQTSRCQDLESQSCMVNKKVQNGGVQMRSNLFASVYETVYWRCF